MCWRTLARADAGFRVASIATEAAGWWNGPTIPLLMSLVRRFLSRATNVRGKQNSAVPIQLPIMGPNARYQTYWIIWHCRVARRSKARKLGFWPQALIRAR